MKEANQYNHNPAHSTFLPLTVALSCASRFETKQCWKAQTVQR